MTQLFLQPVNWQKRHWLLATVLFMLMFAGHGIAMAGDLHSSESDGPEQASSVLPVDLQRAAPTDTSDPSCDADHDVRFVPGQNRLDSLDIAETSQSSVAPFASVSAVELFSVPPLFGTLLRTLLQVYLN